MEVKEQQTMQACLDQALVAHRAGDWAVAEAGYRRALQAAPAHAAALTNLGSIVRQRGDVAEAIDLLTRAVQAPGSNEHAAFNLGNALQTAGRGAEAVAAFRLASERQPGWALAWNNLAACLLDLGRLDEADAASAMALECEPGHELARRTRVRVLQAQGRLDAAWTLCAAALAGAAPAAWWLQVGSIVLLNAPDLLGAHLDAFAARINAATRAAHPVLNQNLGALYMRMRRPAEAEPLFRALLAVEPENVLAWTSLGNALKEQGDTAAAFAAYERALELDPADADAASQACSVAQLLPVSPEERRAAAVRYGRIVTGVATGAESSAFPRGDAGRQCLTLGLVSGDWYRHAVAHFMRAWLPLLDRGRLRIVGYSTQPHTDDLTPVLRGMCDGWASLWNVPDAAAAERIRADGVDVLIDLSGHTAYHRLPLFARRPAPLQVSYLGYFASTGVATMDYLLVDPVSAPPDYAAQCTERLWHLPASRFCFAVPDGAPAVARRDPAQPLSFGSFSQTTKITDAVLALWARVLAACPGAHLRVQTRGIEAGAARQNFLARATRAGIPLPQLLLLDGVSYQAYLEAYAEVDFILDTFPYTGGTTSCEALWMGVPTLTLAGDSMLARQGASILTAAGLPEWVVRDEADYVAQAMAFARDRQALADLRQGLRTRVAQSPLMDAPRFARDFAAAIGALWRAYCAQE